MVFPLYLKILFINNELTCFGFANFDLNNEQYIFSYIKIVDDKKEDFIAFSY